MERTSELVIIGAGPAGLTAALYASRAGLQTTILEMGPPGGKLIKTSDVRNWPGTQEVSGFDLATEMFTHATAYGATYTYGNVQEIVDRGEYKEIIMVDDESYFAKAVIIATGTKEKLLDIPKEEINIGRGISYCAVCDGAFFKNKEVAVIGGGNSALEEALYLTQFASKVSIVMRRDVFRADEYVVNQIKENDKIELVQNYIPLEILDNDAKVTGIKLQNTKTKQEKILEVDGIFPYIGADPMTGSLQKLEGVLDEDGYMLVNDEMQTCISGIYGAGDVNAKYLRQIVTAASDGATAAQSAFHSIRGF